MRPGTPGFVGPRLREAREARGLSAIALADLLGISRQAVSQYETGEITPGPEVMRAIADRMGLPVQFFRSTGAEADLGAVFFRSMAAAVKPARLRARRRYAWLRAIADYVGQYVDLPPPNLPDLGLPGDPTKIGTADIEGAASALRRHWRLGEGSISNVVWMLENQGVVVARDELGAIELDAFSSWVEGTPFVVLGSDKAAAARSRFDAAHELGHLVLHRRVDAARLERKADFKLIEHQAHRFAGAFLLPAAGFARDIWVATLDELLALKPKWGVSLGGMIHRAADLELVSADHAQRLWRSRARRGWAKQEPLDDEMPMEQPRLLRRSFELILDEAGVGPAEVLDSLPYAPIDIEDLAALPRGQLSEGPLPLRLGDRRRPTDTGRPSAPAAVLAFPGPREGE